MSFFQGIVDVSTMVVKAVIMLAVNLTRPEKFWLFFVCGGQDCSKKEVLFLVERPKQNHFKILM